MILLSSSIKCGPRVTAAMTLAQWTESKSENCVNELDVKWLLSKFTASIYSGGLRMHGVYSTTSIIRPNDLVLN